jgi:DUF4097 and DUF4098 domain-containing protein YvlB
MKDEKKKILEMIAAGTITPEEGAMLLEALEKGEKSSRKSYKQNKERSTFFNSIADTLTEIGPLVQNTLNSAMSSILDYDYDFKIHENDEDYQELPPREQPIQIEEGEIVSFKTRGMRSGDLTVESCEGDVIHLSGNAMGIRFRRNSDGLFLSWSGGHLKVGLPTRAGGITAKTMGGNIFLKELGCESTVSTMGGDIELSAIYGSFDARTMGGDVIIELGRSWSGDSVASTMGGNIGVRIYSAAEVCITAKTMGGKISVDEKLGDIDRKYSLGSSKISLIKGDEPSSKMLLKTAGGNIFIRGYSNE